MAFSNGLLPTIYRNCAWNAVYFGTMHKLKTFLPQPDTPSHFLKAAYTAVTGSSAAAFATIFSARKSSAYSSRSSIYVLIILYRFSLRCGEVSNAVPAQEFRWDAIEI